MHSGLMQIAEWKQILALEMLSVSSARVSVCGKFELKIYFCLFILFVLIVLKAHT